MNIAIIVRRLDGKGGTQRQALILARELIVRRHDVKLYTLRFDAERCYPELSSGLTITSLDSALVGFPRRWASFLGRFSGFLQETYLAKRLSRFIAENTEMLNPHDSVAYRAAYYFKRRHSDVPSVWAMNDVPVFAWTYDRIGTFEPVRHSASRRLVMRLLDWYDRSRFVAGQDIIAVLDHFNEGLVRKYLGRESSITRLGIDAGQFSFMPHDLPADRQGRPPRLNMLAVGIFFPHRRFEDAIEAAGILRNRGYEATLTIIGSPKPAPAYAERLKRLVAERGLGDAVTFAGEVSEADLLRAYREHDVFVFTNYLQTWGHVPLEAMATGIPAIVSRGAGVHEVLTDGETALLVDPKSPAKIADAAERLIKDPDLYRALVRQGRKFVEEKITWSGYADAMLALFNLTLALQRSPKKIFITSFHPLISRNILSTPLLAMLAERGASINLLIPEKKRDFFEAEFGRPGVTVAGVPRGLSWRERLIRYLALAAVRTKALDIKRQSDMDGSGAWLAVLIANRPFLRRILRCLDALLSPRSRFGALLDCERPDFVFATDVQNESDVRLIHEARDRGIPVIGMVRSWDNLTSKGLIRALPDVLAVQNEIVRREAIELHGVPAGRIAVVGIPHYDRYLAGPAHERAEFFRMLGLDPTRRLVVYAPVGDRYVGGRPVDRGIIADIADALPPTHHLLVRLPPTDSVNLDGLDMPSNVTLMRPGQQLSRDPAMFRSNELSPEDDDLLRDTLAHCDLVISGPSTFVIDAAVFDKPVILVAFDGDELNTYHASIARYYDYEHFQPVLASGGVRLARSRDALYAEIAAYLTDPRRDADGRHRIQEEQCWRLDGRATERLASVLLNALRSL